MAFFSFYCRGCSQMSSPLKSSIFSLKINKQQILSFPFRTYILCYFPQNLRKKAPSQTSEKKPYLHIKFLCIYKMLFYQNNKINRCGQVVNTSIHQTSNIRIASRMGSKTYSGASCCFFEQVTLH